MKENLDIKKTGTNLTSTGKVQCSIVLNCLLSQPHNSYHTYILTHIHTLVHFVCLLIGASVNEPHIHVNGTAQCECAR